MSSEQFPPYRETLIRPSLGLDHPCTIRTCEIRGVTDGGDLRLSEHEPVIPVFPALRFRPEPLYELVGSLFVLRRDIRLLQEPVRQCLQFGLEGDAIDLRLLGGYA